MTRIPAKGTVFSSGGASSNAAYTALAQVKSIGDFGGESSEVDCTDLSSTAKEFIMGLTDNGSVSLNVAFDPANAGHVLLNTRQKSQELDYYKVILSDTGNAEFKFTAYVKSFKITGMSVDGLIEANVDLRISGAITFSA